MGVNETNKPNNRDKMILRGSLVFYMVVNIFHPKYVGHILKEPKTRDIYKLLIPWLGAASC